MFSYYLIFLISDHQYSSCPWTTCPSRLTCTPPHLQQFHIVFISKTFDNVHWLSRHLMLPMFCCLPWILSSLLEFPLWHFVAMVASSDHWKVVLALRCDRCSAPLQKPLPSPPHFLMSPVPSIVPPSLYLSPSPPPPPSPPEAVLLTGAVSY
jgi:hypothetical protein